MKFTLLLISTLALISCNSKESSKKQTCTYNDLAVDCSSLKSGSDKEPLKANLELKAEVRARTEMKGNTILVLENTEDIDRQTANGQSFECIAGTDAGDYRFEIVKNDLHITKDGKTTIYKLYETSSGRSPQGYWKNIEVDKFSRIETMLSINSDSIYITTKCSFF